MKKENPNAFKLWISPAVAQKYFRHTKLSKNEISAICKSLERLELKARVRLIAKEMHAALPSDYEMALTALLKICREEKLKSFELWPATEFIQLYGLDHIDASLAAMYELTPKFTAEFSIRPFINKHGTEIYRKLARWKNDENEHIRRWLSEGTRPRLPWGERLFDAVKNPHPGLEILEALKFDPALYVRKSVANHLNDIAKDHPELVVKTLSQWKKSLPKDFQKEFQFISHRALRTLIKDGHTGALKYMGVGLDKNALSCTTFALDKNKVKVGGHLEISLSLKNKTQKPLKYILDYVIYFKKSNGDLGAKVFKWKSGFLAPNESIKLSKKHSFKPITTRKYYSGEHRVAAKVNGGELKSNTFSLKL